MNREASLDEIAVERLSDNIFKIGPLGNPPILCVYLVASDTAVALVDCGPRVTVGDLLSAIERLGYQTDEIDSLLLTHIHVDHAGGTADFIKRCRNAKAYVPRRGYTYLLDPAGLNASARRVLGSDVMEYWGDVTPVPKERLTPIEPRAKIEVGNEVAEYIPATGHAPHQCVILDEHSSVVFVADALGIIDERKRLVAPTSPPPAFDFVQSVKDIKMVSVLGQRMLCFPHFRPVEGENPLFKDVLKMYDGWESIIRTYLRNRIEKRPLSSPEYDELYRCIKQQYPVLGDLHKDLRHQVREVYLTGFVQWCQNDEGQRKVS